MRRVRPYGFRLPPGSGQGLVQKLQPNRAAEEPPRAAPASGHCSGLGEKFLREEVFGGRAMHAVSLGSFGFSVVLRGSG
jgi:hypothetical protein